jgi:hypothetical protein
MRILSLTFFSLLFFGCAFLPSVMNQLTVRPVKYVPCWENMGPNTSCGSVTVEPKDAEGFIVVVGWKLFDEIVAINGSNESTKEYRISKYSEFAANEVVSRGYCQEAFVPKDKREIMGWEGSGDRGIYVTCSVKNVL